MSLNIVRLQALNPSPYRQLSESAIRARVHFPAVYWWNNIRSELIRGDQYSSDLPLAKLAL